MSSKIDYEKLTERELRDLINKFDTKAEEEFMKRIDRGEIKRKTYTIEELEKLFAKEKGRELR